MASFTAKIIAITFVSGSRRFFSEEVDVSFSFPASGWLAAIEDLLWLELGLMVFPLSGKAHRCAENCHGFAVAWLTRCEGANLMFANLATLCCHLWCPLASVYMQSAEHWQAGRTPAVGRGKFGAPGWLLTIITGAASRCGTTTCWAHFAEQFPAPVSPGRENIFQIQTPRRALYINGRESQFSGRF